MSEREGATSIKLVKARNTAKHQRIIQPEMSMVPKLRYPRRKMP